MAKRDYSDTGQRSQSEELFEDIFQLALTKDQRRKKGAKPVAQTVKKSREALKAPLAQKSTISPAPPLRRGEAMPPQQKKEKTPRKKSRSGRGTKILLTLLLLVLMGAAATFYLPQLNLSDFFQKTPEQSTIKREMPPKPPQRPAAREPEKPSSQVPVHVPRPVPPSADGRAAPPQPSTPPRKDTLQAGQQQIPAPKESQPVQPMKAPAAPAPPPSRAEAKSFPYSIYLGSFRKEEALQNALRIFEERGLSPYLVRMDLGEKGVWLRVFSGHFENQEEAEAWIKKNQIADAEIKHTRYAVLLGEALSKREAETRAKALDASGCHPYIVGVSQTGLRIYSGAYYRMEDAEKELAWLASKGVKGKIVER